MSGNCELGRGLRTREKNATEGGAGRFEKTAPDARAAPPEAHESLIGRKTVEEVPLTGLSSHGRPTARMTAVTMPAESASDARDWMHELAAAAEAARCGEIRSTSQEQWDDLRAERG